MDRVLGRERRLKIMSVENHPNINAVGLVSAVIEALIHYSRGNAVGNKVLTEKVKELTTTYCIAVSEALDEELGVA